MWKILRFTLRHTLYVSLVLSSIIRADSVLDFQVRDNRSTTTTIQSITIKNGQIMVKAAGGNKDIDLLYSRAQQNMLIVDHQKRRLMIVDEVGIARLNQQAQGLQPLMEGFSEQVAKLSAEERQKWQGLLGSSVSLDKIARATEPVAPTRLVPIGAHQVAGIRCQEMQVMQGQTSLAKVCLAQASAMNLPGNDHATIRALFDFYDNMAGKSQKSAQQFGLSLPTIGSFKGEGIPIKLLDLSRAQDMSMTLLRVNTAEVASDLMMPPSGYRTEPLSLWL